jgi:hypothetical protein
MSSRIGASGLQSAQLIYAGRGFGEVVTLFTAVLTLHLLQTFDILKIITIYYPVYTSIILKFQLRFKRRIYDLKITTCNHITYQLLA